MIYLYISNSNIYAYKRRNNDKFILMNIKYVDNYFANFDAYVFNIRVNQLHLVPKNDKLKIFIFKNCCNKREVVRKVGACHNFNHKVYFV